MPSYAITGEYTFIGSITHNGRICSQQITFHVDGPPKPEAIFSDGFESGNLSKWSTSSTYLGDLSVTTSAALVGSYGLQAAIDDNTTIYVTDNRPEAEKRYRARWYFDPGQSFLG